MQATQLHLPLFEKKPLSKQELEKISIAIHRLTGMTTLRMLLVFGIALLIAIIPVWQPEQEFGIGQFGLFKGLFFAISILALPLLWDHFSSLSSFKKDLREQAKIIHQTAIAYKKRTFLKNEIYARLAADESGFHAFEIDTVLFDKLKQGQQIWLEYAQNSRCLLKIEW